MIPENLDPSFKRHIIYSIGWLIGGILMINFLIGDTTSCDLEKNPLCPEQIKELNSHGVIGWCVIVCIMVVIRILAHKFITSRNNEVSQI